MNATVTYMYKQKELTMRVCDPFATAAVVVLLHDDTALNAVSDCKSCRGDTISMLR